jgi:hypothetical protein
MYLKNIFFIIFFILILNNFILYGDTVVVEETLQYKIEVTDNINLFEKDFDDFNCIHHLFVDIFYVLELNKITLDEKIKIISIISSYLKGNNKIDLYIKKYKFNKVLTISLYESYKLAENGSNNFLLATNFERNNNKLLKEKEFSGDVYAKLYYLKNGLFVNSHYIFDKKKEKDFIEKKRINNLADYYLFDDNISNDSQIEDLLKKGIIDNNQNIYYYLTLIEFYLSKRDFIKAEEILNQAKKITTKKNEKDFNAVNEEFMITKAILK